MIRKRDWEATAIYVAAMLAAVTRWTGALLSAEGFDILQQWLGWWVPGVGILGAAMAVVEAWSFAYIFFTWRSERDKGQARILLSLAGLAAFTFLVVLTPYIMTRVEGVMLREILALIAGGTLWGVGIWAFAVGASTISIVAGVGYADGRRAQMREAEATHDGPLPAPPVGAASDGPRPDAIIVEPRVPEEVEPEGAELPAETQAEEEGPPPVVSAMAAPFRCWCGWRGTAEETEEHDAVHVQEAVVALASGGNPSPASVVEHWLAQYGAAPTEAAAEAYTALAREKRREAREAQEKARRGSSPLEADGPVVDGPVALDDRVVASVRLG